MGWVAVAVSIGMALSGCGADATDDSCPDAAPAINAGFTRPASPTAANERLDDGSWGELGPADWSCLGQPAAREPTRIDVALAGVVTDSFPGEPVPGADVAAFHFGGANDGQLVDATTTDGTGAYELAIPTGTAAISLRVTGDPDTLLDLYELPVTLDPDTPSQQRDIVVVSRELSMVPDAPRVDGGFVLGRLVDCRDRPVSHAVATVSVTAEQPDHLPGATTNYFSAGNTSLPVRLSVQSDTNRDGMFVIADAAAQDPVQVQAWGVPAGPIECDTPLALLGALGAPVLPNSVVVTTLEPRRAQ